MFHLICNNKFLKYFLKISIQKHFSKKPNYSIRSNSITLFNNTRVIHLVAQVNSSFNNL